MAAAYIETSVPSYYVARPSSSLIQAARQATPRSSWNGVCSRLDLYTSLEPLDEAGRSDKEMIEARSKLLEGIEHHRRLAPVADFCVRRHNDHQTI